MFPSKGIQNQRALVLQLLRTERVSLEDAQTLFSLLDARDRSESDNGNDASDSHSNRKRMNGGSAFVFDLSALAERVKESWIGLEYAVRETIQAADLGATVERAAARMQSTTEGRRLLELNGTGRSLIIDNPWGDIVLRGVPGGRELDLTYRIAAFAENQRMANFVAERTGISFDHGNTGIRLEISPPDDASPRRIKVDMAIDLPASFTVRVESDCGDITAADIHGGFSYSGGIGQAVLQRLHGPVEVRTHMGDVSAELDSDARARIEARCSDGGLDLGVPTEDSTRTEGTFHGIAFPSAADQSSSYLLGTESGGIRITSS